MVATFETPRPSVQLKTIHRYYDALKVWDLTEVGKLFADDFVQSTRPLSLGVPSRTQEEDLEFLRGFSQQLNGKHLEITIYDVLEAPGRAWVNVLMHGEFPDGKTFDIESIYKFTFVEHSSPHKIKAVDDFLDSAAFARLGESGEPSQG